MLPPFPADESASLLPRRPPSPLSSSSRSSSTSQSRSRERTTLLPSPLSYGAMSPRGGIDEQQPEMMAVAGGSGTRGALVSSAPGSPARASYATTPMAQSPARGGDGGPFATSAPRAGSPTPSSSSSSAARLRKGKQAAVPSPSSGPAAPDGAGTNGTGSGDKTGNNGRRGWRSRFPRLAFELENKGSVARDHLASERTFLAWLRTSLGLASIGIAVTQLFRLPSNTTTNAPSSPNDPTNPSTLSDSNISSILSTLSTDYPALAPLVPLLQAQEARLVAAEQTVKDSTRYKHLGKPLGGTFIMLGLVFLLLGIHRFFTIQQALMKEPSMYPPSRRSVGFASFCVGALTIATFVAILTVNLISIWLLARFFNARKSRLSTL
ncbi:hypothetical protein JCM6882_005823 [Rhodosporidiobolus microsporus]